MMIRVDSGKYTFVKELDQVVILRHGEAWHEQTAAFNALSSIMAELDAARVVLKAARQTLNRLGYHAPLEIQEALRRHSSLVDDREEPSKWCDSPTSELKIGDSVRVTDGPFANFSAMVVEVKTSERKAKVSLSMLGRTTFVELDFAQFASEKQHEEPR